MKKFNLGVFSIDFDDPAENYRALRVKYKEMALVARWDFEKRYLAIFSNPWNFSIALERVSAEYLNRIVDSAVDDLIEHGVIDIDEKVLIEHYSESNLTWMEDIALVRVEYNDILKAVSNDRSDDSSGGGVVGGGFGVEGAASGIAMATAANAAIGVANGLFRAVGSSLNSFAVKQSLAQLIASPSTAAILQGAIENLVFNLHKSVIEVISSKRPDWKIKTVTKEEEVSARCMLNNVIKNRFLLEKDREVLATAISLNPYDEGPFLQWRKREFSHLEELVALAEYVGLDLSVGADAVDLPSLVLSSPSANLSDGFRRIVSEFKSPDFFALNLIPENKKINAIQKYFHRDFFLERSDSGLGVDEDLGPLLALVDATVFGSAENGLAISCVGLCWVDQSDSGAFTWREFVRRNLVAKVGFMSVNIGDKKFGNNSQVKNVLLVGLINDLADFYRSNSSYSNR